MQARLLTTIKTMFEYRASILHNTKVVHAVGEESQLQFKPNLLVFEAH